MSSPAKVGLAQVLVLEQLARPSLEGNTDDDAGDEDGDALDGARVALPSVRGGAYGDALGADGGPHCCWGGAPQAAPGWPQLPCWPWLH